MNIVLKKSQPNDSWGRSTLLGNIDIDKRMMSEIDENYLFLMQVNLEDIKKINNSVLLPKTGLLYFFVNLNSYTPLIKYRDNIIYNSKFDARGNFNENLGLNYDKNGFSLDFTQQKTEYKTTFLNENSKIDELNNDEIVLFEFHTTDTNLFYDRGNLVFYFIMKKPDLLKMNYSSCRLIVKRL